MSSTRRATDGQFHQERFCSAPEFEGDTINGLAAAKRIAIVKDRATRELLLWIQWLSLTPRAIQSLCDELIATFPDRIGSPTLRRLKRKGQDRRLTEREADLINLEFGEHRCGLIECWDCEFGQEEPEYPLISSVWNDVLAEIAGLQDRLTRCCLDPEHDIAKGVWFFEDLFVCLTSIRQSRIEKARSRLADTAITREINDTLDFAYARRQMVLIEGVSGIGRSETSKAWCEVHAGMVRYVEVPSSGDDRSIYSAVARALGVARGFAYNPQQIKLRVEDALAALAAIGVMLVLDESQFLWPQVQRPRGVPPRMLWIKTLFDAGTPIALIALDDFSRWQELYVKKTLWTDQQFVRRRNRRVLLPTEHSKDDMLKIARSHFPDGDLRSWKLLAAYALGTEKKQASGIVHALESARYRAELAGRDEAIFQDVEDALHYDHGFLLGKPGAGLQAPDAPTAERLQTPCSTSAKSAHRRVGECEFPIRARSSGSRITRPSVAV